MAYAVQSIDAPLSQSATFLVLTVDDTAEAVSTVREVLSGLTDLVKDVGFRGSRADFSCIVGIGSELWPTLTGQARPKELHPFTEFAGSRHTAIATPGDLLFHLRSERQDLCFEFERLLMDQLRGVVEVVDRVTGFRYFDSRDLLGFVDGTANPIGPDLPEATTVGEEDPEVAGGSYVVVQKYLHTMQAWSAMSTEEQQAIIGRTKIDNVELPDADVGQKSHKTLNTIVDDQGVEHDILRDNMPFGDPGADEFGTYFIGYSRQLWVIEQMLQRMFIGDPPGLYDRLLDFSEATTGVTFFAPSADLLDGLADVDDTDSSATAPGSSEPAPEDSLGPEAHPPTDGSLGIGSLRTSPSEGK